MTSNLGHPATAKETPALDTAITSEFQRAHYTRFVPNPANPRRQILVDDRFLAVAASIKADGVVEPVVGIPLDDGQILLVCGHVRRRAVEYLVEQGELPPEHPHCYLPAILEPNMPPERQISLMSAENEHRIPLSPVDEGLFYQSLLDRGWSKNRISRRLQVSPGKVQNRLDIAAQPESIRVMFVDNRLPLLAAGPLLAVPEQDRLRLARMLAGRNMALERIQELCEKVREQGLDGLLNRSPNDKGAPRKPPGGETRQLPPGRVIGLAALRAGILETCRECDAAPTLRLPDAVRGQQINAAAEGVCAECNVRDLVDACEVCPLVAFLEALEVS